MGVAGFPDLNSFLTGRDTPSWVGHVASITESGLLITAKWENLDESSEAQLGFTHL